MSSLPSAIQTGPWHQWLHHPQRLWLRKVLFQIHLYCGISLGLYIFFISLTGSVLVYRNELYVIFTPEPVFSTASTPLLSDDELRRVALQQYPDYAITRVIRPTRVNQAVEIWLENSSREKKRLFDPRTGADAGSSSATGVRLVTGLIEIHKEFLAGTTGRIINGIGAIAILLVALTGLILWWPGIKRWRRSLALHKGVGWRRMNWDLHSMVGIWSVGFILIFALSGIYLCFPETIHAWAERIQPFTEANAGEHFLDGFLYWLAFLHFGRINGIGLPCDGPGVCDQSVKAVWALFGLAPALMIATGSTMWWNRVLRRWWARHKSTSRLNQQNS